MSKLGPIEGTLSAPILNRKVGKKETPDEEHVVTLLFKSKNEDQIVRIDIGRGAFNRILAKSDEPTHSFHSQDATLTLEKS